jgi:Ca-activated chloride channel family protein
LLALLVGSAGVLAAATAPTRAVAQARTASAAAPQSKPSFAAGSRLVVLSATAFDRKGRPVQNLAAHEFRIFEEGRPQPVARFSSAHDLPARVLLLVDASGSMNAALASTSVRMAVAQVLGALGPDDHAALAGFDSEYRTIVPFTRERARLRGGLDELAPFGATALHDALDRGADEISAQGEGRRAIVVVTDGVDTASRKTPEEVLARSRALDVPIYTLSVVSAIDDPASPLYTGAERPVAAAQGLALLERYAALSGGDAFVVSDFPALRAAALRIGSELKHQYRLGYDPPDGPQRFRRIEVRSTRKGVSVRTRSGYVPLS